MNRNRDLAEVAQAIRAGRRFLLLSHRNPDGDAIGSCLALAAGLLAMGRQCDIVNSDGVPANLAWLPLAERIQFAPEDGAQYDTVVLLDCGARDRTGVDPRWLEHGEQCINIDHHPSNQRFGTANLVDPEACATAELVFELLRHLELPLSYSAATCIYTGILTDTGSFRFSNASAQAFDIASQVVAAGVDPSWVAHMVFDQQPIGRLRLLSRVLETLQLSPRDKVAAAVVTQHMLRATHTGVEDVEGFVNFTRSICGVEVGLLLREEAPNRYRVALRSKGQVDVSRIARSYGGGGHRNAAGATIDGPLDRIRRELFQKVEEALDEERLTRRRAG